MLAISQPEAAKPVWTLRAWCLALPVAVLTALPTLSASRPSPVGVWLTTRTSSGGVARCTLARSDGASRIEILTEDARVEIQATSGAFFTNPIMTYPIVIGLDDEAPIVTKGAGLLEHGVVLAPNEGLTGDALLARMARASSMTVKEDIWTNRFDLGGLAEALPKLEECRKTEAERAASERARIADAEAANARDCDALIGTVLADVGGERSKKTIQHPLAEIRFECYVGEKPSVSLLGRRNGFAPEFLELTAHLAADLADLRPEAFKDAPARCLTRVVGFYKMGKVGRHHPPPDDMPRTYEGTLSIPRSTIRCGYVGADKRNAYFWIGGR